MESSGKELLLEIRSRIIRQKLAEYLLYSLAGSILISTVLNQFLSISPWYAILFLLILLLAFVFSSGILKFSVKEVTRLLDLHNPVLEESSALWLSDPDSLNLLQTLQVRKLNARKQEITIPNFLNRSLKAGVFVVLTIIISIGISQIKVSEQTVASGEVSIAGIPGKIVEKIPAGVKEFSLRIKAPAYTGLASKVQEQFSASFYEGSTLSWSIETNQSIESLELVLNDKQSLKFSATNADKTVWVISQLMNSSGFYQLRLNGKLSDFYQLVAIPDEAPVIRITKPEKHTSIDFGQVPRVTLNLTINDDFGINQAMILATVSSGSGEGVKFKEHTLQFNRSPGGSKNFRDQKSIDLRSLGMVPGDELYFYVSATDSKRQQSRSDMYIVSLPDTAELMSMDGLLGGINLVPEYFRSQRQIIIDTEKLIKEKAGISSTDFKNRSNNLGLDQKMLRLRYGKFLGEESETEIGEGHAEESHEGEGHDDEPADFGNAESIMDSYAHKHDIAEDATFFEPELKAQLKAVLTEMWKSELKLRTHAPTEALPFEYKALRLLKDLQQQSRVYVAKTAFRAPLIKPEKRMSGELDKIIEPKRNEPAPESDDQLASLRKGIAVLDKIKQGAKPGTDELTYLDQAGSDLAAAASKSPEKYLKPLAIIRRLAQDNSLPSSDIRLLQNGINLLIKEVPLSPGKLMESSTDLSRNYFRNLTKGGL